MVSLSLFSKSNNICRDQIRSIDRFSSFINPDYWTRKFVDWLVDCYKCWCTKLFSVHLLGVFARLWKRSCRRVLPARHCTDEQIASRFSWTLNNRKLLVFKVIRIIWFLSRSMMGPVGVQKERYRISLKFPLKYIPFIFM